MKKGLIMEGGAMRGMFTAGVIDVMMENNIEFDGAIGVSAGATFGCNYKSKQIGRVIRYNTRFCKDKRYCGLYPLIKEGNIFGDFAYNDVPLKYDPFDFETYENNPMDFYLVATDIESGKPVYHRYDNYDDHGFDWIKATSSMPLVSQIVEIDNHKYLDGGISDSIPLTFFENIGYDRIVIILTQPKGYRKTKSSSLPLIRRKYKKYPNLIKAMEERHLHYNKTLDAIYEKEKKGKIYVIRPESAIPVSRVERNPEKLQNAYEMGRNCVASQIQSIQAYLKK